MRAILADLLRLAACDLVDLARRIDPPTPGKPIPMRSYGTVYTFGGDFNYETPDAQARRFARSKPS